MTNDLIMCPDKNQRCFDSRITGEGNISCRSYRLKKDCLGFGNLSESEEKYYFIKYKHTYSCGDCEHGSVICETEYEVLDYHPFIWMKNNIKKAGEKDYHGYFDLLLWQPITREEYELWQEVNK